MAATACLFNLSKNEIGLRLHPKILGQIVKLDLDAMETFPQYHQVISSFSKMLSYQVHPQPELGGNSF